MNGFVAISILGVFEVLLALIVYLHDPKRRVNRLFLSFVFSVILWTVGNFLADLLASLFWTKTTYLGAVLIFYNLLLFTEEFPARSRPLPPALKHLLATATALLALLMFLPQGLLVERVVPYAGGVNVVTGPFFPLLTVYFLACFTGALAFLIHKLRRSSGVEKMQVQYITFGLFISLSLGLLANLVIPLLTGSYESSHYGPYGVAVFLTLTTFAIVRYNLLNITVIATEVFVVLLILILLGQVFIAATPLAVAASFTVLILAAVLAYFLIRSMLREVRQKEQLTALSQQLEEANEQLKRLDETKSEFVSIASHQLRTPLTVIKGYISMVLEGSFGSVPEKQRGPLDKVYESGERLIELVENLLSVSRIESGRMKYTFAPTQLATVAAAVVDELLPAAKKKALVLKFLEPQKLPPLVSIDAEKIRQVMTNLVDNAIKYTKKGSVTVAVRADDGAPGTPVLKPSVVFEVKDTGGGVLPEDQDRLFQKFIRGQGSALVHTEGTGLGLYVGRMMVEAHGGTIWVASKGEGLGSTFAFAIPTPPPPADPTTVALNEILG